VEDDEVNVELGCMSLSETRSEALASLIAVLHSSRSCSFAS
jgi:hypothetical protein